MNWVYFNMSFFCCTKFPKFQVVVFITANEVALPLYKPETIFIHLKSNCEHYIFGWIYIPPIRFTYEKYCKIFENTPNAS